MFIAWKAPRLALAALPLVLVAAVGTLALQPVGVETEAGIAPSPKAGALLSPMQELVFRFPSAVSEAAVHALPPVEGSVTSEGNVVSFKPAEPLRPGAVYRFAVSGTFLDGRRAAAEFSYPVMPLDGELWIYVKLDRVPHEVFVYRGAEPVRRMTASGGKPGFETPQGTFRIQNRGYHFYSQKYGEGAYYWMRIFGNYLFHSVPVDVHGRVIQEEAEKLGCPASHGCVRLSFEDAKWLYGNVPDGALVVIDGV